MGFGRWPESGWYNRYVQELYNRAGEFRNEIE